MKQIGVALLSVVLLHHPTVYGQTGQPVDFLNYTYPLPICTEEFETPATVTVQNGRFDNGEAAVSVDSDRIFTADLTGDNTMESIVPVYCGWNGANFVVPTLLIYTTGNGTTTLLAQLDESDFGRDYAAYYPDDSLWSEVGRISATGSSLFVEKFAGGAHCCPEFSIILQYVWDGNKLASAGQPAKKPMATTGQSQ